MKSFSTILMTAVLVLGCATEPRIRDVAHAPDASIMPHTYHETAAWAVGRKLYVQVDQVPGLNLARITPKVYRSEVYLEQLRISSGGGGTRTFEIDLSRFELPADWERHVYWIADTSTDGSVLRAFFNPGLPGRTDRIKIQVDNRDPKLY